MLISSLLDVYHYVVIMFVFIVQSVTFLRNHVLHKLAASWQNQQNGMCAQRRLRSAWASAQSDQSLRCPHEENLGP